MCVQSVTGDTIAFSVKEMGECCYKLLYQVRTIGHWFEI